MKLLTIEEAAELLRMPIGTLRHHRLKKTGPPSAKLGRRVVYREDELQAWIRQQFAATKK